MEDFIAKISKMTPEELDILIKKAEYNYIYDISEFTDEEYDSMIEMYNYITGLKRVSNVIEKSDSIMVKLPVWMPSLDKMHHGNTAELKKFVKNNSNKSESYIISAKMDGGSALLDYNNGNMRLYTRGTYATGQDITLLLKYISIPKKFNEIIDGYVRGEIIIPNSIFEAKYSNKYTNARALIGGLFRSFNISNSKFTKTMDINSDLIDIAKNCHFVSYEIILYDRTKLELKPSKQLKLLTTAGFDVVLYKKILRIDLEFELLSNIFDEFVSKLDYNIDGLVIYNNINNKRCVADTPNYAIAYKKELENLIGYSKVINIEWNISQNGYIKPIIYIEPIIINKVKISKTTGKNARFIINNNIGPGAEVKIIRSGDVIPNIAEVITPASELKLPDGELNIDYEWNETKVDFVIIQKDKLNKEMQIKKILHFFEVLNINGIGEKIIIKIGEQLDIYTINDYIDLDKKDLTFLGDKTSDKIINGIKDKIAKSSLSHLMHASGLFINGLGEKKLDLICKNISLNELLNKDRSMIDLENKILKIKGFADITMRKFVDKLDDFLILYFKLKTNGFINEGKLNDSDSGELNDSDSDSDSGELKDKIYEFKDKKIVLTGFRDKKIENLIIKSGGIISNVMNKSVYLLIIKDNTYINIKTKFAEANNINIITMDNFIKKYYI